MHCLRLFLYIVGLLTTISISVHGASRNVSASVADLLLEYLIAGNPATFNTSQREIPEVRSKSVLSLPSRLNDEELEFQVFFPGTSRFIIVYIHTETDTNIPPAETEACLIAFDNLLQWWIRNSAAGGKTVLPKEDYPFTVSPPQAEGTFIEIEDEGEDGGMNLETLQLALKGLWTLLVGQGRPFATDFEIWYASPPP